MSAAGDLGEIPENLQEAADIMAVILRDSVANYQKQSISR